MGVNHRLQLACVWAGPLFLVTYLIAFWPLAHFMPPPSPHWSEAHVAAFFAAHRTGIRIGMVLGMVSCTLLFPYFAVISVQIARIERRSPVLAIMQFGAGVLLLVFFFVCAMLWIVAAFRPHLPLATLRLLNDAGWLVFVMVFPEYTLQMLCMAIAGFIDKSPHPTWPRWASYFNIWVGISGAGGGIACFFMRGAFAWNGVVGFFIPLTVFAIWLVVNTYLLHTAVVRQAHEEATA